MTDPLEPPTDDTGKRDWRGTPILVGSLVIYGAPVGRSIALVEAEVVGLTQSGRVNVRILRRAYGGGYSSGKAIVHVGADRMIVVNELPPTEVPLEAEAQEATRQRLAERQKIAQTHDYTEGGWQRDQRGMMTGQYADSVCTRCGDKRYGPGLRECPDAVRQ